ncbi:hypothetical protein [Actinopolymorpha pittospori]|uniref:Uncharacterized protein n=1 Tax=Actinopolymorpha pittospori TaxID=648752 RepID=A0A927RCJ3_9ACTN|nr:hypothetical protein [Actinopolymorpha pittospori]MBE1609964.1 hypothetical protein [Actinopolymorpha pittospori]
MQHPDWSALGQAIDYRLRLSFGGRLGPAVTLGVAFLDGPEHFHGAPAAPIRHALSEAGRQLLATVDAYLAAPGRYDEEIIARLCFVAAFYEDIARNGRIRRFSMLTTATRTTTLAELTAAVPTYAIDDIAAQTHLAERALAPLRALPPKARVCGPIFAGSDDIGGADADYILGGLLLDCKATTHPRNLGRNEIYQLAGYLLLDYDDQYSIDRVGLYLSRQGGLIIWDASEFLRGLGSTTPLPELRHRFRDHLRDVANEHGPRSTPPTPQAPEPAAPASPPPHRSSLWSRLFGR